MWRGPKTLPKLGEALGRGVKEAKTEATKAQAEIQARTSDDADPDRRQQRPTELSRPDPPAADRPTGRPR